MFQPNQRVTVDLSGLVMQQMSTDPTVYKVELLFSFKGVKRVEVPEERIHGT